MRLDVKYRVSFFAVAISVYAAGFQLIPASLVDSSATFLFASFAFAYFVLLPLLYWRWIIVAGRQKAWKILIVLSTSSLFARLTFPEVFAQYFEFIAWLRYPIIAVLLLIQLVVFVHIVKQLWSARHLKGDPRGHALDTIDDADDKKRDLALLLVYEPTAWYYAIPYFSRNHLPVLGHVTLWSGKRWHFTMLFGLTGVAATLSYLALMSWSELAAIIVSSLIGYTVVTLAANYRISKHYSLYIQDGKLIINNSFMNFMAIPLADIRVATAGNWQRNDLDSELVVGRGTSVNMRLEFKKPQTYFALMGTFQNAFDHMYLCVNDPVHIQQQLITGFSDAP